MYTSYTPPTILIAENNADILSLLKFGLTNAGYRVIEAADGEQAVRLAIREQPGLILTEVCLPHLDGLAAARLIRQREIGSAVPIVAISDYLTPELHAEILAVGCNKVITKPFTLKEITQTVRQLMASPVGNLPCDSVCHHRSAYTAAMRVSF